MIDMNSFPSGTTILINSLNRPFQNNNKKNVYLPGAIRHSFLQNPSWSFRPNEIKFKSESNQSDKESQEHNTTIITKPLPNLTLQIQLPTFYSLATILRYGHMSQLVEKWLCNPVEQLKRQSKSLYTVSSKLQSNKSLLPMMSNDHLLSFEQNQRSKNIDDDLTEKTDSQNRLVCCKKNESGLMSLTLCLEDHNKNLQAIEFVFLDTLILETSTVISVSYNCGSFSLSIQSISNSEFVSTTGYPVPVLVNCQFNQSTSITLDVAQLGDPLISTLTPFQTASYYCIENDINEPLLNSTSSTTVASEELADNLPNLTGKELDYDIVPPGGRVVEFMNGYLPVWTPEDFDMKHNQFTDFEQQQQQELLEYQEDESSEDYDDSEDSEEEELSHMALLSLVQDTLEYIKSNGGAYSDELNALKDKLQTHFTSCFE